MELCKIENGFEIRFDDAVLKNWNWKCSFAELKWIWIWWYSFEKIEIENAALQNWNKFEIEFDDQSLKN